jgi:hypothetical protein
LRVTSGESLYADIDSVAAKSVIAEDIAFSDSVAA